VSDAVDLGEKIVHRSEANEALAEFASGNHLCLEFIVFSEEEVLSDADFAAWPDEALPFIRFLPELASKQYFHASFQEVARGWIVRAERLRFSSAAAAIETRRENTSVVEDDEIVGAQKGRKVTEPAVFKPSGCGREVKKPRGGALWKRLLGDQFFGKIVMEIGNKHAG